MAKSSRGHGQPRPFAKCEDVTRSRSQELRANDDSRAWLTYGGKRRTCGKGTAANPWGVWIAVWKKGDGPREVRLPKSYHGKTSFLPSANI